MGCPSSASGPAFCTKELVGDEEGEPKKESKVAVCDGFGLQGVSAQKSNLNEALSPGLGDERGLEQLVSGGVI